MLSDLCSEWTAYCSLPPLTSPKTDYLAEVITDAFVAVIVCYSVNLSLEKVFAKKHGYVIYSNQVQLHMSKI